MRPLGAAIVGRNTSTILVGAIMDCGFEAEILRVGHFYIRLINIRVSIITPFMLYFILPINASIVTLIILARVLVNFLRIHLLSILADVVILG